MFPGVIFSLCGVSVRSFYPIAFKAVQFLDDVGCFQVLYLVRVVSVHSFYPIAFKAVQFLDDVFSCAYTVSNGWTLKCSLRLCWVY